MLVCNRNCLHSCPGPRHPVRKRSSFLPPVCSTPVLLACTALASARRAPVREHATVSLQRTPVMLSDILTAPGESCTRRADSRFVGEVCNCVCILHGQVPLCSGMNIVERRRSNGYRLQTRISNTR